ncbi:MAG: tetratricopeptide repeat protein [Myxococcales bacterium]|nr:tetratricopeptide repeat protein [Myxococcales bacterium]
MLTADVRPAQAQVDDDDAAAGTPASKTFERAIDLYKKKDYYSSTIELKKVLDGDTSDDAGNKQRAEFYMGKTLYQMGYYASAQSWFEKIVTAGAEHAYYPATLKWLAALSRVLPETSGILDLIGKYDPSSLDEPIMEQVRDELYFLLGRHFYNHAEFDKAIELFGKVGDTSDFYVKAKFFEGVTYVRKYEGRPAGEAFKRVLEVARERPKQYKADDLDRYEELAVLQMARVFYSTQDFDKAIRYYEKLEQTSGEWPESLFEASWAYFMKTNNPKALGNIHTLNAPYFENQFFPESILLKSVIYYKYCLYDRALEAVSEFNTKFKPLRENLQGVVGKYEDNAEFYEYVKKIKAKKAGLDDVTQRLTMSVLGDKTLGKTFAWVDELDHELQMLSKADKAWQTTAVAGDINADLELVKSVAAADAGRLAKERLNRLVKELQDLGRDGIKIRIEVLDAQAGKISAERTGDRISKDRKEDPIIVDDEHFVWRFNGEYWKDELGYYRFKVRSQCPK